VVAGRDAAEVADSDVRESIHRLHAAGALLVEEHEDLLLLRMLAGKRREPGEP
jgi:hypothetical protein